MCANGVRQEIVLHLWKAMIKTISLYTTQFLQCSTFDIMEMDKLQYTLTNVLLVSLNTITKPLLNGMNVNKIVNL